MKEEDMSNMIKNFSNMMNNGSIPDNVKQAVQNIAKKNEASNDTSSSQNSDPIQEENAGSDANRV